MLRACPVTWYLTIWCCVLFTVAESFLPKRSCSQPHIQAFSTVQFLITYSKQSKTCH